MKLLSRVSNHCTLEDYGFRGKCDSITSLHAASFFNAYKPRGAQSMTFGIIGIPSVGNRSVININPLSRSVTFLELEEHPFPVIDTQQLSVAGARTAVHTTRTRM